MKDPFGSDAMRTVAETPTPKARATTVSANFMAGYYWKKQYGGILCNYPRTGRSEERRELSEGASVLFGGGGECFVPILRSSAEPARAVLVIINKVKIAIFGILFAV